jgi:hypothetical protein
MGYTYEQWIDVLPTPTGISQGLPLVVDGGRASSVIESVDRTAAT